MECTTDTYVANNSLSKKIVTIIGIIFGLMLFAAMINISMLVSIVFGPLIVGAAFIFILHNTFTEKRYQFVLKQILMYASYVWGFTGSKDFSLHDDLYIIILILLSASYLLYSIYVYQRKF